MRPAVRVSVVGVVVATMLMIAACGERESGGTATSAATAPVTDTQATTGPSITYTAEPDPPRAGSNAVSVVVRGADGAPMEGLAVTATYFMPAMPSMSMPEMRDEFVLAHKEGGRYDGEVRLSMGGTWAVTVIARRGEETVARKVFNIVAKQ